jgi:hypothetical protein
MNFLPYLYLYQQRAVTGRPHLQFQFFPTASLFHIEVAKLSLTFFRNARLHSLS